MNTFDYLVVGTYLIALIGFGFLLRQQNSEQDYYLGGRELGWFPLTLSVMATQLSAISFVSAPAFVGLREGGGLQWLTFELAVPLAMLLVMFVIAPPLYRAGIVSIYDFLDRRFGRSTRLLISLSFQIVRSFSTGIMVYAIALILEAVLAIPLWQSVIAVGLITLIYATSGGMKAVVYGDAIQMVLILGGILLVTGYAVADLGGIGSAIGEIDRDRLQAIDVNALGFSGDEFGLFPMLFGGFVLYASYYACDQSQAQRILSARNEGEVRRLLFANGLLRFPIVVLYCFAGLVISASFFNDPELLAKVPTDKPDYMMPIYIIERLPHGVIGLLIVAMLSAAMSSLSSAVNSLAAATEKDLAMLGLAPSHPNQQVQLARALSIGWGLVILILSFFAGSIAPTVIEAINKVGSALYGPILGVFLMAILQSRRSEAAANIGLLVGLALNLYFWLFVPNLFWMWWNVIGLVVTLVTGAILTLILSPPSRDEGRLLPQVQAPIVWTYSLALIAAFIVILGTSWGAPFVFG
ncbi:MAG: sodium/solute symporter [Pseudomonadota bacterium]